MDGRRHPAVLHGFASRDLADAAVRLWRRQSRSACLATFSGIAPAMGPNGLTFLHPHGPIAAIQRAHLIEVVALLTVVVLPVLIFAPLWAWHFRYSNGAATYRPRWSFSWPLEILVWGVPFVIVVVLAVGLWRNTRELDPYAPLASGAPMRVQVVGYDWKWLFIYPDRRIASMGELAFPADRPLALQLTSGTVMQSFFIPALGSQIYTMAGMITKLHLKANGPGAFRGENSQYNGDGFYRQHFVARAMTTAEFNAWADRVTSRGLPLSASVYRAIEQRSTLAETNKTLGVGGTLDGVLYLSHVPPGLFQDIVESFHAGPDVTSMLATAGAAPGVRAASASSAGAPSAPRRE